MKILVDTSVWSLALRRDPGKLDPGETRVVETLAELIRDGRVAMIGPIRQELLSGITDSGIFRKLKSKLRAFEDEPILTDDHEQAAAFFNACRVKGVQGSHTDFLICAVSARNRFPIFTIDKDFAGYARILGIAIHLPD